jgi:hypothetical protein
MGRDTVEKMLSFRFSVKCCGMSRHCRATEMYMHQRAIKPSHTLSVVSLSNPEKQNPLRNARSRRYAMAKYQVVSSSSSSNSVSSHRLNRFDPAICSFRQSPRNSTNNLPITIKVSKKSLIANPNQTLSQGKTHLALTVSPKIHPAPNKIIQRRVRRLVQQHSAQSAQRQPQQARHHAAVQVRTRHPSQRPLVGEAHERDDDVEDLQDGDGLDGGVEVFGQEVEEEFGPEEGFEGAG